MTPKGKSETPSVVSAGARAALSPRADRTSTVVAATLILLTILGVVTVFWEPLAALAQGSPATESPSEARATTPDAGAQTDHDASGNS